MKQNITLSLEKNLIKQAKILASRRDTSVSRLLSEELEKMIYESEAYDRARRRAIHRLSKGFHLGGTPLSRHEIYDR